MASHTPSCFSSSMVSGLQADLEELRQNNQILQDGVAFAGHEWRNQLSVLNVIADKLLAGFGGSLSEKQQQMINEMKQQVFYLERISNNYLNLAFLLDRHTALQIANVCLYDDVLLPLLERHNFGIDQKQQHVQIDVSTSIQIHADLLYISSVVENLLLNAMTYGAQEATLTISVERIGTTTRFTIQNTGSGISTDILESIFERFNGDHQNGTGIGLYLCRKIIELHGGKIWAESDGHSETAFIFELPSNNDLERE